MAADRVIGEPETVAGEEIELKLAMAPNRIERVRRNPAVRLHACGRSQSKTLISTYFDTPDLLLSKHRIALRVRRTGHQFLQTVKMPAGLLDGRAVDSLAEVADGALRQQEFEKRISGEQPELEDIEDMLASKLLGGQRFAADLLPIFTTEVERRTLPISMIESEIEMAFDLGVIRSGDKEMPISEVELELKSGRSTRLYELALQISKTVDCQIEYRSKARRGFDLFQDLRPEPEKATRPQLDLGMSVGQAFTVIAYSCMKQIRANEGAVLLGEDPEGIHQWRVALRRLRALVSLFRDAIEPAVLAQLAPDLRWAQQQLGPARDWDVFLLETVEPLLERLPEQASLLALKESAEAARDLAYDTARETLGSRRYARLLLLIYLVLEDGSWQRRVLADRVDLSESSLVDRAGVLVEKRARKLKKLGRKHKQMEERDLHEVRILGKKLRYAVEFFRDLYPAKSVVRYQAALVALQDTLGSLNDAVVGQHLIEELDKVVTTDAAGEQARAQANDILLGWYAARIDNDLRHFSAAWKNYSKKRRYWSTPPAAQKKGA
jgi:inorganic triphosphatase YgiF